MTFKIHIYLIFVYFFLVTSLNSQNLGLYFTGSCPQKSLQNLGYKNGLGFSLEYLSNQLIKKESFCLRLSIGFDAQWHGHKNIDSITFNTPNNDKGYSRFENSCVGLFLGPKFTFNYGLWEPYFELNLAFRQFMTNQISTFYKEPIDYQKSTSTSILSNNTNHYGLGLGSLYHITDNILFDMRVSYSFGTKTDFVSLNSVSLGKNGVDSYDYKIMKANASDLLFYRIGFIFHLKKNKNVSSNTFDYSSPIERTNSQNTRKKPVPNPKIINKIKPKT